ncbi:unnamed protein product [Mycena citricolor]|uniref:Uncharacterized protein n=1 Tax=Mycena citricolor TaxID=2018698 RepID=A0AAD2HID0_9AGAR|nr:unnamed protein product [Mycena citricolor]
MSKSPTVYLAHFLGILWACLVSLVSLRRPVRHDNIALPTTSPRPPEPSTFGSPAAAIHVLDPWQRDKQDFLRRPSLLKASASPAWVKGQKLKAHWTSRKKSSVSSKRTQRTSVYPPPPEIYVQDWSSVTVNMDDLFHSPEPLPKSEAPLQVEQTSVPEISPAPSEESADIAEALTIYTTDHPEPELACSPDLPIYSPGDMFSAAGDGPFCDPFASQVTSPSIPLPATCPTVTVHSETGKMVPVPLAMPGSGENSHVPYVDIFDLDMYANRMTRHAQPVCGSNVQDGCRSASFSVTLPPSPQRSPLASVTNANLDERKHKNDCGSWFEETSQGSINTQWLVA